MLCDQTRIYRFNFFLFIATLFKRLRKWAAEFGPVYKLTAVYLNVINVTGPEEFEVSNKEY